MADLLAYTLILFSPCSTQRKNHGKNAAGQIHLCVLL